MSLEFFFLQAEDGIRDTQESRGLGNVDKRQARGEQQSAIVRVATLSGRQFGVVARRQIGALEISDSQIAAWLRASYLHRIHPGVYAVGHTGLSDEGWLTAAVLYAGPGAMLSHATAAWWLGLISRQPSSIELSTPRRCRSLPGIVVHERRELHPIWHRGLPATAVSQALLDLARTAAHDTLRRALAEAEYQGWLEIETIVAQLGRGKPGAAGLLCELRFHRQSALCGWVCSGGCRLLSAVSLRTDPQPRERRLHRTPFTSRFLSAGVNPGRESFSSRRPSGVLPVGIPPKPAGGREPYGGSDSTCRTARVYG